MIKRQIYQLLNKYYKNKYGSGTEVCSICYEDGEIRYKFMDIFESTTSLGNIRSNCGQSLLTRHGLMLVNRPATVILLPHPSLIKKIGFWDYLNLIREWRGDSKVGDKTIVIYKVIGD